MAVLTTSPSTSAYRAQLVDSLLFGLNPIVGMEETLVRGKDGKITQANLKSYVDYLIDENQGFLISTLLT